jgi:hypothetical protein
MTPVGKNAINKKWLLQDASSAWQREIGLRPKASNSPCESEEAKRAGSRAERKKN